MGGENEGGRGRMVLCVLKDGAQRDVCVYAAGKWQGTKGCTCARFEEGAHSTAEAPLPSSAQRRQAGLPARLLLGA